MKTVFPVHRFPVASSFKRILLSAAVCISDEALYAVVDPFDDFECIGFVKNSSLLFIRNESSSFLIIYEANRKNFFFVDFCTSMDKIRASFLHNREHMHPQSVQQTSEISLNIFVSRKKCFVYNSRQAPLVPGEFWDSFTNHNTGNYLRHGIKLTANQRLSPTLWENQNAIKDGATEKSLFSIFSSEGRGRLHTS